MLSAIKTLKRQHEFLQLSDARRKCRAVQAAAKKATQVTNFRTELAPVSIPLFFGVPLKDWLLAAKARREMQDFKAQREQRQKKLEAAKQQAQLAQRRKAGNSAQ